MPKRVKLTTEERKFFSLVSSSTFSNPFSVERRALDREIGDTPKGRPRSEEIDRTMRSVLGSVEKLISRDRARLGLYDAGDQRILKSAFLFEVYHRFIDAIDAFIVKQEEAGASTIRVPFTDGVFAALAERGFSSAASASYLALFYQVRRAFYFIENGLTGQSDSMIELRSRLWNSVFTFDIGLYEEFFWNQMEDFSTLLVGETGTGKGAAAAAIGKSAFIPYDPKRRVFLRSFSDSLISINLSQFSETLIESELFGHRKGSFTGAMNDHEGLLAKCVQHGSVFLDEIGDVSTQVQVKLLRVLQEREFMPIGSHDVQKFQGRVIAATNRDLSSLRTGGDFRDDFYYRLCSDVIEVPPLRKRVQENSDELRELIDLIVLRITRQTSTDLGELIAQRIGESVGADYHWPGNVRELEQAIRRILLTRQYTGELELAGADPATTLANQILKGELDAKQLLSKYCGLLYERFGTYEKVAAQTDLDRRTVKKYVEMANKH